MKFTADCVPCLLRRVLFQSRLVGNGKEFEAVREACRVLSTADRNTDSVAVSTEVHRAAYRAVGVTDPYAELKIRADEEAKPFAERLESAVSESEDPLRAAILGAVAGNIMDFGNGLGIDDPGMFSFVYDTITQEGLGCDDTDRLRRILDGVSGVMYIFDNCGESRLDAVLIRLLKKMGKRVVGVVRGAPILNDVTEEDAIRIGLDKDCDRILTTGKFYVGADWDRIPDDIFDELEKCGLIIAKGMANYEAMSGKGIGLPVAYILRTKCAPVAESLGIPQNVNAVKVVMPERLLIL